MRLLLIGVSALALVTACKGEKATSQVSTAELTGAPIELESTLDSMAGFKAKDYGETDAVLEAMGLDGDGLVKFSEKDGGGAKTTLSNVTVTIPGDDEGGFSAESLVLEGLHETEAGAAFDRLTLKNVKPLVLEDGLAINVDEIVVFEPNDETAAAFSTLISGEDAPEMSFASLGFERLALSGLTISKEAVEGEEDGEAGDDDTFSLTLGELAVGDLANAMAGLVLLDSVKADFDIEDSDTPFPMVGGFNLGRAAMTGVRGEAIDHVVSALEEGDDDPQALADAMAAANRSIYAGGPLEQGFNKAQMSDFVLDISGAKLTMPSSLTEVARDKDGVVTKLVTNNSALKLTADAEAGGFGQMLAEQLGKLGYEELTLQSSGSASFDPKTDLTSYEDMTMEIEDAVKLGFSGDILNLGAAMKAMSAEIAEVAESEGEGDDVIPTGPNLESLQNVQVKGLTIDLEDQSILDRGFKLAAEMQGMEADQLRAMVSGMVGLGAMQGAQMGLDPDITTSLVSGVSSFIDNGGKLSITIKPETPVTMSSFSDMSQVTAESLGLSVTHSE